MYELRMKRIYEGIALDDGQRILVDRLWPRGVKKDQAALAAWPKEITPSAELRKLYHAGELPFEGFAATYLDELEASAPARAFAQECRRWLEEDNVTLRRTRNRTTSTSCAAGCCTRWACARSEAILCWCAAGIGGIAGPDLGQPHSETSLFVAWRNCAGIGMSSCQMMRTGREPLWLTWFAVPRNM